MKKRIENETTANSMGLKPDTEAQSKDHEIKKRKALLRNKFKFFYFFLSASVPLWSVLIFFRRGRSLKDKKRRDSQ